MELLYGKHARGSWQTIVFNNERVNCNLDSYKPSLHTSMPPLCNCDCTTIEMRTCAWAGHSSKEAMAHTLALPWLPVTLLPYVLASLAIPLWLHQKFFRMQPNWQCPAALAAFGKAAFSRLLCFVLIGCPCTLWSLYIIQIRIIVCMHALYNMKHCHIVAMGMSSFLLCASLSSKYLALEVLSLEMLASKCHCWSTVVSTCCSREIIKKSLGSLLARFFYLVVILMNIFCYSCSLSA